MENVARTEPFNHWVIDDALDRKLLTEVSHAVPATDWPHWVRYAGAQEQKRTCRDIHRLSGETCRLFHLLNSVEWIDRMQGLTGMTGLLPDPTFHGGGLHCCDPGGFLDIHVDYALHPQLRLERRLNLVLFLNEEWHNPWGGALELWDETASRCVTRIVPRFNRLVLWEPNDVSFHGHPQPLACPSGECRKTAAVYYLSQPRGPHVVRQRALFVPQR